MRVVHGQREVAAKRAGLNNVRSVVRRLWHSFTWFMALRLGSGRSLRRVLTFGFILSGMLACAVPLYNLFVENVQIQQILATTDPLSRNVSIQVNSNVHDGDYGIADTALRSAADRHLASFTGPLPLYYVLAEEMSLLKAGDGAISKPPDTPSIRLEAADYVLLAPHMKLIAGRVPQQVSNGAGAEAIVTVEMASLYHLKLGNTISAAPPEQPIDTVTVHVVGIWQPRDEQDPFWNGWTFESQGPGFPPPPRIFPVLLSYDDLFASARDYDSLRLTQNWIYFTDSQRITGDNRQAVVADIQRFRADIGTYTGLLPTVATRLDSVLSTDQMLRDLVSLPLYLVTVPTLGLALLLVAMVATMLVEVQSQKIATLRTRGLSGVQLLAICAVQGLPSALLGVLAGPLYGAIAALALVWMFMPHALLTQSGVTLGYLLRLIQPRTVLVPVLLASLLGLGVFLAAELRVARLDVLAFRRETGRSSRIPFWHQYYLDVGLLLLSTLGYLDLWQFGSTDTRLELGTSANSPLLFLAPSLLLLGGGLALQRAMPLVSCVGRKLAGRRRGVAVLFFVNIERNPARYMRVVLFLAIGVGLGLFALSYDASLEQNIQARAAYQVGADVRMTLSPTAANVDVDRLQNSLTQLRGVTSISPVFRDAPSADLDNGDSMDLLGVDPSSFGQVVSSTWSNTFSDQPLSQLMQDIGVHDLAKPGTLPALVSGAAVQAGQLHLGDRFVLQFPELGSKSVTFTVTGLLRAFPTLYPDAQPLSFVVVNLDDLVTLDNYGGLNTTAGPNEYWLSTSGSQHEQDALLATLGKVATELGAQNVLSQRQERLTEETAPLNGGMRGLLWASAGIACGLALLVLVVQSVLAANIRAAQFALWRTLGMTRRHMGAILAGELVVSALLALVGGTALGLLLAVTTLPVLAFSATAANIATVNTPPFQFAFNPQAIAAFYLVLVVAIVAALLLAVGQTMKLGLGRTLRVGED